jgi:hypothetical protein
MTRDTLHTSTRVLPGNKIEIQTPELAVGEIVEVFIVSSIPENYQNKNESDPLTGLFRGSSDLATQSEEDVTENTKNIEQLDNAQNITTLGFGEFIQKFRQEHNLAQEGIEPEELLKEVRDLSSGREVIW